MNEYYVDGAYVRASEARIPVTDLAVTRGYGVFEYLRTYGGKPFRLEAHIDRLERSAALISLAMPWSRAEIIQVVTDTLARNRDRAGESGIKVIVTGGTGDGFTQPEQPRLLVLVDPALRYPAEYYERGISVITVRDERYLPEAKTINYTPAIVATKRAKAQGAVDALYVDPHGRVLEATRANLFAFFGDTLATPAAGILYGITRGVVLELAEGRFPVEVRDIALDELRSADEAFITASSKEIMPVVAMDGTAIGDGRPGKRTREMMRAFKEFVSIQKMRG